eukprot:366230-Chlamydomonas_euryale.AAC.18
MEAGIKHIMHVDAHCVHALMEVCVVCVLRVHASCASALMVTDVHRMMRAWRMRMQACKLRAKMRQGSRSML